MRIAGHKKKNFLTITIICLVYCPRVDAQLSVGAEAGVSYNTIITNLTNRPSTSVAYAVGYTVGIPVQYKISSLFYCEAALNITKKNYRINRTDSLSGIYEQYNNSYLQLPLLACVLFGKRLQVTAGAGGYTGYCLSGVVKGKTADLFSVTSATNLATGQPTESFSLVSYHNSYAFNTKRDNRLELGWVAEGGLLYRLTRQLKLILRCLYYQSLTDRQKAYMINRVPQYDRTLTFTVGSLFHFK